MSAADGRDGPGREGPAHAVVPAELAALARRAGVEVTEEEWPYLVEAYRKTRVSIDRLSETLRPGTAPAIGAPPDRVSS